MDETVISIADATIPKTSKNPKHPGKQWLNDDCKDAIKNRKKAKRHRTTSAISPSSGRKLEEHWKKIGALSGVILFLKLLFFNSGW
jgi:hypothetical protein